MLFSEAPVSCSPGPLQDQADGSLNQTLLNPRRQRRENRGGGAEGRPDQWQEFPCRLSVEGEEIHVTAELPGVTEEMIRIDLDGRTLIISAERREQRYRASLVLPWEA
ncbi:MAG TPA: Hsp20/alpha crystallin family protein, partial [Methanomicrobiales archaeon]|nr:Hsp20/alpha crystallin family protein [Methanomicrobiales archaeon]